MEKYIVKVYEDRTDWTNEEGLSHRLNGPAREWANGSKAWYQNGKYHRTDGPAVEYTDGRKSWYQNGKRHRTDGPAIEWADGEKYYYINGECLTEEEFNNRNKPTKPCLGKKVTVDGVEYTLS
jgi:hypothetical protein